jgi:hypothetical protein
MILAHDLLTNPRTAHTFAALPRTKRIVDVGCGVRPCPAFPCEDHICIEPHVEYVAHLTEWRPHDRSVTIANGTADVLANQPRADTTVLLLDVIEHMERDAGEQIKTLMEEFEHAVIFTPLGWFEQGEGNPDAWGLNGGKWQKHRSAWHPGDFQGWKIETWRRWHPAGGPGAILATR